jgi:hypothetical protein
MKASSDIEIKLRVGYALSDRLAPIACAIVKNITTSTKMIDDLPSAAIEAMLDYSKEQDRLDRPRTALERAYKDVRQALITYGEVALREARSREDHLLEGVTGRHRRRSSEWRGWTSALARGALPGLCYVAGPRSGVSAGGHIEVPERVLRSVAPRSWAFISRTLAASLEKTGSMGAKVAQ